MFSISLNSLVLNSTERLQLDLSDEIDSHND